MADAALNRLLNLKVARDRKGMAPNKPLLMAAILGLVEAGLVEPGGPEEGGGGLLPARRAGHLRDCRAVGSQT